MCLKVLSAASATLLLSLVCIHGPSAEGGCGPGFQCGGLVAARCGSEDRRMREAIATLCPFDAKACLEVTGIVERGGHRRVPVDLLDDRMFAGRSRGVAKDTQHRVFAMRRLIRDQLADLPIIILLIAFADARGSRLWRQ